MLFRVRDSGQPNPYIEDPIKLYESKDSHRVLSLVFGVSQLLLLTFNSAPGFGSRVWNPFAVLEFTLKVQILNNHILTQNRDYHSYYPNPKYLLLGYMDPKPYSIYIPLYVPIYPL